MEKRPTVPSPYQTLARAVLAACAVLVIVGACSNNSGHSSGKDWSGEWRTFWRNGGYAAISLQQNGREVVGTYQPGDGVITGEVSNGVLTGRFEQTGSVGTIIFALSDDGDSFAGRFGSGEYWNGVRVDPGSQVLVPFTSSDSPRETLQTIVAAANASSAGKGAMAEVWLPLIAYDGPPTSAYDHRQRRDLFLSILDMSTFRIRDAPAVAEPAGTAIFPVGPVDRNARYDIDFRLGADGRWRVLLPSLSVLKEMRALFLAELGFQSYGDFRRQWSDGPRQTVRQFLEGVGDWQGEGREQALSTLDLSSYSPTVQSIEGPLTADFLRRSIDRIGYIIWQELPNDPNFPSAYTLYENAGGAITISPSLEEVGSTETSIETVVRWKFSSETVRDAQAIFEAIRRLPLSEGLQESAPLSGYFALRNRMERMSPMLLRDFSGIEIWQWIALLLLTIFSVAAALTVSALGSWVLGRSAAAAGASSKTTDTAEETFLTPIRLLTVSGVLFYCIKELGLRADLAAVLGTGAIILLIFGVGLLLTSIFELIVSWLSTRDDHIKRKAYIDDDILVLVSGIAKIVIWVSAVIILADVVGLPYEGVVAGLGVGGLALAIAARDTVANFIGAATILADRPFKRGDLVEISGLMATVEEVGLRATRLRTLDDSLLVVPNAQVADNLVNNWGLRRNRRIVLQLGLTYDTPREKLDAFVVRLKSVYANQPLASGTVYLGLKGFAASSIDIELAGFFRAKDYDDFVSAQHQLVGDIVDAAAEEGVEFAFPTRTVHVAKDQASPTPHLLSEPSA